MRARLKGRSPLAKGVGFLEEFSKNEVKGKVDIVALFASFGVRLEKKGSSWMGRCPFHEDRKPSLSVDNSKGLYHCFGCGESGDVFDLVMRFRALSFSEALSFLKDFAPTGTSTTGTSTTGTISGDLEPQQQASRPASPREAHKPEPLLESQSLPFIKDVIAFYRRDLESSKEARAYLQGRGLMPEILGRLEVGFASGELEDRIGKEQRAALMRMGILNAKGKEHFAGCITIPLWNLQGEVVSLYGRRV